MQRLKGQDNTQFQKSEIFDQQYEGGESESNYIEDDEESDKSSKDIPVQSDNQYDTQSNHSRILREINEEHKS